MNWIIKTSKAADKEIKHLDKVTLRKLDKAISQLEENPFRTKTERMSNYPYAQFRHRIGDYRILFDITQDGIIQILHIWHRGKDYKK